MELFDASPLAAGISHLVDPERVFLFGFSDGATVGVELMLTRRFTVLGRCRLTPPSC